MRLWFDDIRREPPGWVWARTVDAAKDFLETGLVDECSLDHDMGLHELDPDEDDDDPEYWDKLIDVAHALKPRHEENGYDLVNWMIEHDLVPELVRIHSWNPNGRDRMAARLNRAGYDCVVEPFKPRT
jgi:hypothetical protein